MRHRTARKPKPTPGVAMQVWLHTDTELIQVYQRGLHVCNFKRCPTYHRLRAVLALLEPNWITSAGNRRYTLSYEEYRAITCKDILET